MMLFVWMLVLVLAAVFGSFANVLVYRLPFIVLKDEGNDERELMFNLACPASHCPACETPLRWWHNIPLVSYIALGGRCGFCGALIPRRYFWIELGSVIIGLYCYSQFGWSVHALMWFVFLYLLWVMSWIDVAHFLLPDVLTLLLLWLALLWKALVMPEQLVDAVLGAALGYVLLRVVYEVHHYFTGRQGMGMGDMKLMAAIGAWLGLLQVPNVLLVACAGALLYAACARLRFQAVMIPFGPFLAFGAVFVLCVRQYFKLG